MLGVENPVQEVFAAAKRAGALTVLDGAQSVPTRPVDVADLGCDALAFSGHKMLGPTGIGALVVRPELLDQMATYQTGGGMIRTVAVEGSDFLDGYYRFEAGTPHAAGAVGLAAACDYLGRMTYDGATGMAAVAAYERAWGRTPSSRCGRSPASASSDLRETERPRAGSSPCRWKAFTRTTSRCCSTRRA